MVYCSNYAGVEVHVRADKLKNIFKGLFLSGLHLWPHLLRETQHGCFNPHLCVLGVWSQID